MASCNITISCKDIPEVKEKLDLLKSKLVFISDGKRMNRLFMDGEEVEGIRSLLIETSVDSMTTHKIEYLTAASGKRRPPIKNIEI